jgi:CRP/FNR family cyclic AMP-dependent transcriptional regulator
LTQRVRILTYFVKDLALHSVRERVIHVLLKLAIEQKGKMTVNQRLTHQDIADMVGSSREMVSRIMKDLATDGYIEARQKIITIERKLLCQR